MLKRLAAKSPPLLRQSLLHPLPRAAESVPLSMGPVLRSRSAGSMLPLGLPMASLSRRYLFSATRVLNNQADAKTKKDKEDKPKVSNKAWNLRTSNSPPPLVP